MSSKPPHAQEAMEYIWDAFDCGVDTQGYIDRRRLAKKALKIDPNCADAHSTLGWCRMQLKKLYDEALVLMDRSIEAAYATEPGLREASQKEGVQLPWGIMENRPFLRAVHGKAMVLHKLGQVDPAIGECRKILKWNPSDNQGVRVLIYDWLKEKGAHREAEEFKTSWKNSWGGF